MKQTDQLDLQNDESKNDDIGQCVLDYEPTVTEPSLHEVLHRERRGTADVIYRLFLAWGVLAPAGFALAASYALWESNVRPWQSYAVDPVLLVRTESVRNDGEPTGKVSYSVYNAWNTGTRSWRSPMVYDCSVPDDRLNVVSDLPAGENPYAVVMRNGCRGVERVLVHIERGKIAGDENAWPLIDVERNWPTASETEPAKSSPSERESATRGR